MVLIILFLVAVPLFIARAFKSEQRHKERMATKREAQEAANPQPPARQNRMVVPEIMAELNAMSEALDISGYALEAYLGMEKTASEARREARQRGSSANGQPAYGSPGSGRADCTQAIYSETDLNDWHFSDDGP